MKERLKSLAAKLGPFVLVALVALAGGYWLGRKGPTPDKVTETAKVEEHHVEEVKAAVKLDEKTETKKHRVTHARVETTKRPDGTVTTVRTIDQDDRTDTNRQADTSTNTSKNVDDSRREERSKVTEFRRDWRLSALVGAELQNPLAAAGNPIGTIAYGVHVERRLNFLPLPVFERVWLGGWAIGAGPKADRWMAGVSLGFEF